MLRINMSAGIFTLKHSTDIGICLRFLCAVSSAARRLLLMRIGCNTFDEYMNALH